MEKIVSIEGPFQIGGVALNVVVRSLLSCKGSDKGIWLFGIKFPIALIVISGSSQRAYRTNGDEVSIEQLMEENPEISIDL